SHHLNLQSSLHCSPLYSFPTTTRPTPSHTLFPYTTLFRSEAYVWGSQWGTYARFWDANHYPCQQPPWGTLNAVDLNTGEIEIHRSEEHTSELQSRVDLVCRLLLEKKKKIQKCY